MSGYLIEFYRLGDFMKVTAVDPATGIEACVTFPARGYGEPYMKQQAARLLTRRVEAARPKHDDTDDDPPYTAGNGGIIV